MIGVNFIQAQDDVDEAPGTTGDDSETVNGLECKLSTQTSKVWIANAHHLKPFPPIFQGSKAGHEVQLSFLRPDLSSIVSLALCLSASVVFGSIVMKKGSFRSPAASLSRLTWEPRIAILLLPQNKRPSAGETPTARESGPISNTKVDKQGFEKSKRLQVSYVLDTEDVFRRIRKGEEVSPGHNAEARVKKFESWLDSRQQQILQQQAAMQQQLQQQRNAMAPILEATAA